MGPFHGALDDLVERDRLGFCAGPLVFSCHVDQVAYESRQFLQLSIHVREELVAVSGGQVLGPHQDLDVCPQAREGRT